MGKFASLQVLSRIHSDDTHQIEDLCRLGQAQRPVQVEQADAEVDDDVQRADEHRG